MTREEALNKIGELIVYARAQGWDEEFTEAFETLSAEPCEDATLKDIFCMGCEYKEQEPCEDAISRAAAIKAMDDLEQEDIERYSCSIPEGFDGKRAIEALQKLPSVTPKQKMGRWIPVSERLPETFSFVNCTCHSLIDDREDWVVETCYLPQPPNSPYSDWGNIPMLNWGECEVIAWMYRDIPEPYKAESEENIGPDKKG